VWRKFIKRTAVVCGIVLFWRSAWKLSVNDNAVQVLFFFTEFCWNRRNMLTLYLCRTCCSVLFQDSNSDYIRFCLSWCTDFQNAWHSWVEEWVCLCVFSYICVLIKSLMNTMHFRHEKQKVVMCIQSDIHYVRMRLSGGPWKASDLARCFWGSFVICHLMPCGTGTPRRLQISCVISVQWGFLWYKLETWTPIFLIPTEIT
jgi:hypothetical protein